MRLAHLISKGLLPSQILVLSFSRSAVRTLTRRIEKLALSRGEVLEDLRHLSIRTFDSWAFRLLRMSGLQPRDLMRSSFDDNITRLVHLLRDDTSEPLESFLTRIRHIVIDEAQDIGGVRLELVKILLARLAPSGQPGAGFTILGDDAQAIYQFAARGDGATLEQYERCMDHVREEYAEQLQEVELEENHRATGEIAEAVWKLRELFSPGVDDVDRLVAMEHFVAQLPAVCEGMLLPTWLSDLPHASLAILTRTNGQALRVATHLYGKQDCAPAVPIQLHTAGASAPVPAWVSALLCQVTQDTVSRTMCRKIHEYIRQSYGGEVCRSLSLPSEEQAWLRLLRACGLGEHETSFSMDDLRARMTWPDAFPDDQVPAEAIVLVTTIHQSKGLEFDHVVLLENENLEEASGSDEQEAPEDEGADDESVAETDGEAAPEGNAGEEASVLFVGVTRAARHIGRLPRSSIYSPFRGREFGGGRRRLYNWWNGWVNLEIGVSGDVDAASFADTALHGDETGVKSVQEVLLKNAALLRGRKVVLCKVIEETDNGERHVHYNIHLQEDSKAGLLLGRTCSQLTFDLKRLLGKKYPMPTIIRNLRIGQIVSVPAPVEVSASVPEPWRKSGLWLGITLCGTGDFRPYKSGR